MLHILASTDPTLGAAVIVVVGGLVSGIFAARSARGAALVDDVMADRKYLREEVDRLRGEVDTLNTNSRATETALIECRRSEGRLRERVEELENR